MAQSTMAKLVIRQIRGAENRKQSKEILSRGERRHLVLIKARRLLGLFSFLPKLLLVLDLLRFLHLPICLLLSFTSRLFLILLLLFFFLLANVGASIPHGCGYGNFGLVVFGGLLEM